MKKIFYFLPVMGILLLLSCGSKKEDLNYIRVGITSGPEKKIAEAAQKVAKERYNLTVEIVTFNDYVLPNEALSTGDIDVNAFQHVPYLEEQSKQRGYKLAVVGNTFVYPIVGYSKKIKSISDLKPGSVIAIPNDPTNGGRSLLLLQKYGLLKLRDGVGLLPKVTDIINNPKKLVIEEIEAPQLPRVLDDQQVILAVINNNFAAQAGLDVSKNGVLIEDKDSPYVNIITSREDNKNDEKVLKFLKAYQSEEVEQIAQQVFKGAAVKGW